MITKFFDKPVFVIFLMILLIIISIPFQRSIDQSRSKFRAIENTLYLTSSMLKKVSLGYYELISDIYWLRALQYFGDSESNISTKDSDLLFNYFDIITDLDPNFINAYRFGGSFLSEPVPIGLGDIDKGNMLFDKGRKNNPENFRLPLEQAFLYYLYVKDYKKSAQLFEEASNKPGLSDFRRSSLKGMAASARVKGGERELSKKIWEDIYLNTTNESRKNFALMNLKELKTKDFEDKLTELITTFAKNKNRLPNNLEELVAFGYLKKLPKDHNNKHFFIAPNLKAIRSSSLVKKYFKENLGYINSRSQRYHKQKGHYAEDLDELRIYLEPTIRGFPEHPLDEEYIYDPVTGIVEYDDYFLQ